MLKLSRGGKEANPVDLLSKSKLSKKPKPKKEVKSPEKRGSPSSKEPGDRSCYRCLGNHDHKSCPFLKEKFLTTVTRPATLQGLAKPRKGTHKLPTPQSIMWTVITGTAMIIWDP